MVQCSEKTQTTEDLKTGDIPRQQWIDHFSEYVGEQHEVVYDALNKLKVQQRRELPMAVAAKECGRGSDFLQTFYETCFEIARLEAELDQLDYVKRMWKFEWEHLDLSEPTVQVLWQRFLQDDPRPAQWHSYPSSLR